jgi:hypothetical protein
VRSCRPSGGRTLRILTLRRKNLRMKMRRRGSLLAAMIVGLLGWGRNMNRKIREGCKGGRVVAHLRKRI